MAAKRHYENATIFNARIVNMRHLWEPSTEYQGKPVQRPNHFATFIVPKTKGHWSEEPAFAGVMGAYGKLVQQAGMQFAHVTGWPIRDGDVPEPGKDAVEWAKGHWVFGGSTGNLPTIEIVQNGAPVKLTNRAIVKPGDFVAVGLTAAFKQNDARGIKHYLNTVLFTGPGEEIAIGSSGVSGNELLQQAQQQGMNVTGFTGFSTPATAAPFGGQSAQNFTPAATAPSTTTSPSSGFVAPVVNPFAGR